MKATTWSSSSTAASGRASAPAGADTLPELERWDTFYYLVLTAEDEADLDALWADSHMGRWE